MLLLFLLALLLRVWFAWPALTRPQHFLWYGDEGLYYGMAVSLAQEGRIEFSGHPTAYTMPFFSMALAPIYYFMGHDPYAPQPFIVLVGALTCVGVYALGRSLFNPQTGWLAGFTSSLDSNLIYYSGFLLTETLFVFLVLCSLLALERWRQIGRWQWAVIAGSLMALATLTRVNFAPFVPFALGWLVISARVNRKVVLRDAGIIVGLISSLWLAWIIRNYLDLGTFVPLTTQSGDAYLGIYNDVAADPSRGLSYGSWVNPVTGLPTMPTGGLNEVEEDRVERGRAIDWLLSNPGKSVSVALMQPVLLWQPQSLWDLSLILLAAVGFVHAVRQHSQGIVLWAILAVVLTAASIVSIGVARFRLPLDPGLIVLASFAIVTTWQKISAGRRAA